MDGKTAIEILREIRNEMDAAGESSDVAIQHAIQTIEALERVRAEIAELRAVGARHRKISNKFVANTLDSIAMEFENAIGKQEG